MFLFITCMFNTSILWTLLPVEVRKQITEQLSQFIFINEPLQSYNDKNAMLTNTTILNTTMWNITQSYITTCIFIIRITHQIIFLQAFS